MNPQNRSAGLGSDAFNGEQMKPGAYPSKMEPKSKSKVKRKTKTPKKAKAAAVSPSPKGGRK